jgi:uncharacterized protein (DUF983 family)
MSEVRYIGENDIVRNAKKCEVCGRKPWDIHYWHGFVQTFYTCGSCKLDLKKVARNDWTWFGVIVGLIIILYILMFNMIASSAP